MENESTTAHGTDVGGDVSDDGGLFAGLCSEPLKPTDRPGHLELLLPPGVMLTILLASKTRHPARQ